MNIKNKLGYANSLQITKLGDIPMGKPFKPESVFLIKNISDDNITVTGKTASNSESITTVLYPGWNVELFKELDNVDSNKLQYGY